MELKFFTLTNEGCVVEDRIVCEPECVRVPRKCSRAFGIPVYRRFATDADSFINYSREYPGLYDNVCDGSYDVLITRYTLDEALQLLPITRQINDLITDLLCDDLYDRCAVSDVLYCLEDSHEHTLSYWYSRAVKITVEKIDAYNNEHNK